ncbi:MAG: metal ABC transporter permease [Anaerolineae bacterium]|nr:metal ABC transporter permease [Anaerolineae bacterium]
MVGEIGMAWANTNNHCLANCQTVTISPQDEAATLTRQCTNCRTLGISPRDPAAEFTEICTNCGTYSPGEAFQAGLLEAEPALVFWPRSLTVTALMALLSLAFVALLFKELKLATFDAGLARALGFRPGALHYALMLMVSLVAVGAFDAVGSILVIAFFIIPPAAASLLTDRFSVGVVLALALGSLALAAGQALARADSRSVWAVLGVLGLAGAFLTLPPLAALLIRDRLKALLLQSALIGGLAAWNGYDLTRGDLLGLVELPALLAALNRGLGLDLPESWDSSISASLVLMMFFFFVATWVLSPQSGLVSTLLRRGLQRHHFNQQVVLGHIYHHHAAVNAQAELTADALYQHFEWSPKRTRRILAALEAAQLIETRANQVHLTPAGAERVRAFRQQALGQTAEAGVF